MLSDFTSRLMERPNITLILPTPHKSTGLRNKDSLAYGFSRAEVLAKISSLVRVRDNIFQQFHTYQPIKIEDDDLEYDQMDSQEASKEELEVCSTSDTTGTLLNIIHRDIFLSWTCLPKLLAFLHLHR
jgi:hypothetical protein